MAGRYIPPHMRGTSRSTTNSIDQASGDSPSASRPQAASNDSVTRPPRLYKREKIQEFYWPVKEVVEKNLHPHHSTLNASAAHPDSLQYVLVFHQQHPRWKDDNTIFAKTELNLVGIHIPERELQAVAGKVEATHDDQVNGSTADSSKTVGKFYEHVKEEGGIDDSVKGFETSLSAPDTVDCDAVQYGAGDAKMSTDLAKTCSETIRPTHAVAIYEEQRGRSGPFEFKGYFKVKSVVHVPPHSDTLKHMLEEKWHHPCMQRRIRSEAAWAESMRSHWCIVQFEAVETGAEGLSPPDIAANDKVKSVNEMLKELRLQDENDGKTGGVEAQGSSATTP